MDEFEFYMDISPAWWVKSRNNESYLKKYICNTFECDFYPRIISHKRKIINLDETNNFKLKLLDNLKSGKFIYEFLPEDESLKESYSITNGNIVFQPRKKLTNSRLLIKTKI